MQDLRDIISLCIDQDLKSLINNEIYCNPPCGKNWRRNDRTSSDSVDSTEMNSSFNEGNANEEILSMKQINSHHSSLIQQHFHHNPIQILIEHSS